VRILLALLLLSLNAAPTQAQPGASKVDQLGILINRARVERGLLPIARASELDLAAGSTPQQRADAAGYRVPPQSGWIVVEVISAISGEPAGPLDWWLNESPDVHGKVLLDPRWREFGVGYAAGGEFGNYWTVLVGCRPGVVPSVLFDGQSYTHSERCGEATPSLTVQQALGGGLEVRWSGIREPSERDWLGVYRAGTLDDRDYASWQYVSCGSAPLTARASGWCPVQVPDGAFEVRLFSDNTFTTVASSAYFKPTQASAVEGAVYAAATAENASCNVTSGSTLATNGTEGMLTPQSA
jgi:hypothetical protein